MSEAPMSETGPAPDSELASASASRVLGVFLTFLRLGCVSFGGPAAHLAVFQNEIIERRRWLDAATFADLMAFCQFLPGPSSSQTGMGIGLYRAGLPGLLAAWIGFTLPSLIALSILAMAVGVWLPDAATSGALRGIHAAVIAVVAWAVWSLGTKLCPGRSHLAIAMLAAATLFVVPASARWWVQLLVIGAGALAGLIWLSGKISGDGSSLRRAPIGWLTASIALVGAVGLVGGLAIAAHISDNAHIGMLAALARVGALVFGGGHVVLPMLEAEVVPPGWISSELFVAGYGAANAMPGPLFTIAAWLMASLASDIFMAVALAALGCLAIFGPGMLLLVGLLPAWDRLRSVLPARAALAGIGAAVVGLLVVALFDPVLRVTLQRPDFAMDLAVAAVAFAALAAARLPAWLVVPVAAVGGALLPW